MLIIRQVRAVLDKLVHQQTERKQMEKIDLLRSLKVNHDRDRAIAVNANPDIMDIRRRIDENNIAMLKLMQADELLRASLEHHINDATREHNQANPFPVEQAQELAELENKDREMRDRDARRRWESDHKLAEGYKQRGFSGKL